MTPKAWTTKEKLRNWDDIKLKNFFTAEETLNKMKIPMEWEKIFANYPHDKRLMSKIYKNLHNSLAKKHNNSI
jgi:hypothetical protein